MPASKLFSIVAAALVACRVGAGALCADEKEKSPNPPAAKASTEEQPAADRQGERRETAERAASEYQFTLDNDPETPVKLRPEPVLRWPNHERGSAEGGTFLWTARGKPVAMCCIWWHKDNFQQFAFHSLTDEPV